MDALGRFLMKSKADPDAQYGWYGSKLRNMLAGFYRAQKEAPMRARMKKYTEGGPTPSLGPTPGQSKSPEELALLREINRRRKAQTRRP